MRTCSLVTLVAFAACSPYAPDLPAEPFLCGSGAEPCPDGYACMPEGAARVCVDIAGSGSSRVDAGHASDAPALDAASTCAHDPCTTGVKLDDTCDACVAKICAQDDYCCMTKWSSECVGEVSSICDQSTCP